MTENHFWEKFDDAAVQFCRLTLCFPSLNPLSLFWLMMLTELIYKHHMSRCLLKCFTRGRNDKHVSNKRKWSQLLSLKKKIKINKIKQNTNSTSQGPCHFAYHQASVEILHMVEFYLHHYTAALSQSLFATHWVKRKSLNLTFQQIFCQINQLFAVVCQSNYS